jgi:hypothetical protein
VQALTFYRVSFAKTFLFAFICLLIWQGEKFNSLGLVGHLELLGKFIVAVSEPRAALSYILNTPLILRGRHRVDDHERM